ncbi:MFS transporter [Pseudomonas aeruginosa]|uniref:MFS transporter n=1 Tax=Pseudomonas aeruginosa TaxID=287 RepID=UPI0011E59E2B|nr:MFS transporter [Pseudomonas aeruginosa]
MSNTRRHAACLAFGLCLITLAVNLQAPLYTAYAELSGYGAAATASAFSGYVLGVLPVLLVLGGLSELGLACVALAAVAGLPDEAPRGRDTPMLRLPFFPAGSLPYGLSILLAWATVGLVIAVLPSLLAAHGLARWSGFSTFTVISCGLLFQPLARRMAPASATCLGLVILPPSYALLAWGAIHGSLAAVLFGALGASSSCYGFTYLGGLSAVNVLAGAEKPRASAGYFLLAYLGFSLPVIFTGLIADRFGASTALLLFGVSLTLAAVAVAFSILRGVGRLKASASRA